MRPRANASIDGESLQADVMRFMAIIAFCLVAIMALVRDVAPPGQPVALAAEKIPQEPQQSPELLIVEVPDIQPTRVPEDRTSSKPEVIQPTSAEPTPAEPSATKPIAETLVVSSQQAPPVAAAAVPVQEAIELAPRAPVDEPGLSLRFGSDQDFLRLIAKGSVGGFLFNTEDIYQLGTDYSFAKTSAPGELYELMPETIPLAIRASANNAVGDSADFNWGVVMPERIARRIATLVAIERTGQLVINRYGEVQYRATPSRSLAGG